MTGRASLLRSLTQLAQGSANYGSKAARESHERFAFTATIREGGAMVVRVVANTATFWPQQEYGHFETWTEAQSFAALLNQVNGIDAVEAQQIIVSATLASRSLEQMQ